VAVFSRLANSPTADQLLHALANGDQSALDGLLAEYRPVIRRAVEMRMDGRLRARVDASDVVQEAFLEAMRRIDDYLERRPMPFHLWIHKTALESLLRVRRKHVEAECRAADRELPLPEGSSVALAKQLLAEIPAPSEQVRDQETVQEIRQAIAHLGNEDREIILLRNFEELSNVEAAQILGIDTAAASKRYGRALLRLRKLLVERGFPDSRS
jgi:RNA polymerase sigma-70 factor (ECF subfamily)